jgi:hypothetical protein
VYIFLISSMRAVFPDHLILLDLIAIIIREEYKFMNPIMQFSSASRYCPLGSVGIGVLSLGVKARPERNADHSHHLVPRSRMSRSYTSPRPQALPRRVAGQLYLVY